MTTNYIGNPSNRVDGRAKVTGEAKYAAEYNVPDLTYGVVISSAIAKGKIKKIDAAEALKIPGVLQVFTHENRTSLPWFDRSYKDEDQPPGSPFRPLYSNEIQFNMQPIGLVVADTFEVARYAASLVKIEYTEKEHETDLRALEDKNGFEPKKGKSGWKPPKSRGNAKKAYDKSDVKITAEYEHGAEHHNPMEMHATTVVYQPDGKLVVYDKTQGVQNSQQYISSVFDLSKEEATVIAPYIGGAFGSGLRPQYQLFLAVMASLELKRSVRVTLTRQQMFSFGHRPATIQRFKLGASSDGTLQSITHEAVSETSKFENYTENVVNWSGMLYQCDDVETSYKIVPIDVYTPLDMRAPGGATGVNAFDAAIDELAYQVGMDPLEFRLKNYAEKEQNQGVAFSSKELRQCYLQGAEKFGWKGRPINPRSMKEGHLLKGWGVATGAWEAQQQQASAKAVLSLDGKLTVSSATADIGTGTYTIMTQIAADTLGIPLEDVTFLLGDSTLPTAPLQGGSWTASSVGSVVKKVCDALRKKVLKLAKKVKHSPLKGADLDEVIFADGHIRLQKDPSKAVSILDALREGDENGLEEEASTLPNLKQKLMGMYTHSAVFVEVEVDEDLGTVHVTRVVSAVAGGKVLNPKTARSQVVGGIVWGIGMALEEDTFLDHHFGRFINHDLAEYHVPVNADIQNIEVIFVDEHDEHVNELGVKGLGEIGIVGTAAAISNAIFHATGKRVRQLPITLDKLL
jgi:xanthine dehydrogenase YagR molybdenum-binding subunit